MLFGHAQLKIIAYTYSYFIKHSIHFYSNWSKLFLLYSVKFRERDVKCVEILARYNQTKCRFFFYVLKDIFVCPCIQRIFFHKCYTALTLPCAVATEFKNILFQRVIATIPYSINWRLPELSRAQTFTENRDHKRVVYISDVPEMFRKCLCRYLTKRFKPKLSDGFQRNGVCL